MNLEFWAQGDEEQRLSLYLGVHSVDSMDSPEKMGNHWVGFSVSNVTMVEFSVVFCWACVG